MSNYQSLDNIYMTKLSLVAQSISNSSLVDAVKQDSIKLVKNKLKDHFGKEFYIFKGKYGDSYNKKLHEWIKKYDSDFEYHYSKISENLTDFVKLICLETYTFMYIATGSKIERNNIYDIVNRKEENDYDIYIYIFGRKARRYIKELEKIIEIRSTMNKSNKIYVVTEITNAGYSSINVIDLKKRDLNTLYFSHGEVNNIINHIDHFETTKAMYSDKQLLYKTGILLYGEPGTGKSSMVNALATKYKRSIISLSMNKISSIDFAHLTMLINNDDLDNYIILMEDIDTLFLNREEKVEKDKNYNDIINQLLQFLDSNTSPNNVIFAATTNHINMLDKALLREGRFDLKIEVKGLNDMNVIKEMIKSFDVPENKIQDILEDYKKSVDNFDGIYNQSKLQNIIIKYID